MSDSESYNRPHSCLGCLILLLTTVTITGIVLLWKYPLLALDSQPPSIYQILLTLALVLIWFLIGLIVFLILQVQKLKIISRYQRLLENMDPLSPDYVNPDNRLM